MTTATLAPAPITTFTAPDGLPAFWQALATIADFMNAPYPLSVQYRDIVLRARWDGIRNQTVEYVTVNSAADDAAYELRQEWEEYKKG